MTVTLVVVFTCESDVRRCVHTVRVTFVVVFTHCVESEVPCCVHTVRVAFVVSELHILLKACLAGKSRNQYFSFLPRPYGFAIPLYLSSVLWDFGNCCNL